MFPQSFHLRSATRQTISDGDISQTLRSGRQWAVNGDIFVTRKPCFKSNTSGEEERPHCKLGYFVFQKNATITAFQAASFLILIKFENANYVHLIYEPIRPPKCMCHRKFDTPDKVMVHSLESLLLIRPFWFNIISYPNSFSDTEFLFSTKFLFWFSCIIKSDLIRFNGW